MASGLQRSDLISFVIQQMRIAWHGYTPEGLDQPSRHQIGRGCCASRQNSGSESLADYHKSQFFNEEQFRAWDMISGLEAPLLGGHPRYVGILGVNFYPHNEATTER